MKNQMKKIYTNWLYRQLITESNFKKINKKI